MSDYGNRTSKRTKLSEDSGRDAYTCRRRGWKIDNDGWWFRPRPKFEIDVVDGAMGFTTPRRVYSRSASFAIKHDKRCAS